MVSLGDYVLLSLIFIDAITATLMKEDIQTDIRWKNLTLHLHFVAFIYSILTLLLFNEIEEIVSSKETNLQRSKRTSQ